MLLLMLFMLLSVQLSMSYEMTSFKAAVYEHAYVQPERTVVVSRQQALANMEPNLHFYERQATIAGNQNVNIIVFQEDGIYGIHKIRDVITPYMETIPDPRKVQWTPCDVSNDVPNIEVQRRLSCTAQSNSMYVIANYGDVQPCSNTTDPKCPPDGRYQYNTNVVFAPNGTLVARYHKIKLFQFETNYFDTPVDEGNVVFETPFGRFGVMTCFDILFQDPAVSLVVDSGVGNIVFPTAWMDALPLLAAVQFHSAFVMGMGINFLSANLHLPEQRFQGSGIYTPDGAASYYYNRTIGDGGGKLLIAEIPVVESPSIKTEYPPAIRYEVDTYEFKSVLFADEFNFVPVKKPQSELKVCHNALCCVINYTADLQGSELYAFGAFDGLHTYEGQYYLQICTLVKCANMSRTSCGSPTFDANSIFSHIELSGSFSTPYIFPEVLMSEVNGGFTLAQTQIRYSNKILSLNSPLNDPLISASLFARQYQWDGGKPIPNGAENSRKSVSLTLAMVIICITSCTKLCYRRFL